MMPLIKARKQSFKRLGSILILSLILILCLSSFKFAAATSNVIGNLNSIAWNSMSNAGTGTNDLWGIGPINTTIESGYWGVNYVAAFLSGGAPTKALIYDTNGTLIFISNPYTPNPAFGAWLNLYFPSGLTLRDNQTINVVVVTEWSNTMYFYTPGNSYDIAYNATTATTYALPGSVSGFLTQPNKQLVYVSLSSTSYPGNMGGSTNNYGQPTATPTPGPTVPPVSDFGNAITTLVTLFFGDTPGTVGIGIPLIIIAVCAIASYKMAGSWGFFAGFNIGVILCFVFGILQLWVVIVTIIVDALLLYGKVPASSPREQTPG